MNEVKFESQYEMDAKILREFMYKVTLLRPINLIFDVLIGVCVLILLFFFIISGGEESDNLIYLLTVIVIFAVVFPLSIGYSAKVTYKRMAEQAPGKPQIMRALYSEDKLINVNEATGNSVTLGSDQVIRFFETKNLIGLGTKSKQYVLFKKDSFISGTPEEFKAFLRQRYSKCRL